jgi:hypothetical protein
LIHINSYSRPEQQKITFGFGEMREVGVRGLLAPIA